jgi:hypothetical protein
MAPRRVERLEADARLQPNNANKQAELYAVRALPPSPFLHIHTHRHTSHALTTLSCRVSLSVCAWALRS